MRVKINIKKIKKNLGKLPLAIVKHIFLACLFLFFLSLIFGAILFYKYNILFQRAELEVLEKPFLSEEKTYQEVLEVWQEHERIFKEADFKEYPDPFRKLVLVTEEVPEETEELTE